MFDNIIIPLVASAGVAFVVQWVLRPKLNLLWRYIERFTNHALPVVVASCPMFDCPRCGTRKSWSRGESYVVSDDKCEVRKRRWFCTNCDYVSWEEEYGGLDAVANYCDRCEIARTKKYGAECLREPRRRFERCWIIFFVRSIKAVAFFLCISPPLLLAIILWQNVEKMLF